MGGGGVFFVGAGDVQGFELLGDAAGAGNGDGSVGISLQEKQGCVFEGGESGGGKTGIGGGDGDDGRPGRSVFGAQEECSGTSHGMAHEVGAAGIQVKLL